MVPGEHKGHCPAFATQFKDLIAGTGLSHHSTSGANVAFCWVTRSLSYWSMYGAMYRFIYWSIYSFIY